MINTIQQHPYSPNTLCVSDNNYTYHVEKSRSNKLKVVRFQKDTSFITGIYPTYFGYICCFSTNEILTKKEVYKLTRAIRATGWTL
jgi:hypothetical protein